MMQLKQGKFEVDNSTVFEESSSERPNEIKELANTKKQTTPLTFCLKINGSYYLSYKSNEFASLIIRNVVWAIFNSFLIYLLTIFNIPEIIKIIFVVCLVLQVVLHTLLCFLDAGTILQDQEDSYDQERSFCRTCLIYKRRKSKHCNFCNKCVRNYDHHCGIFGKCIGGRNIIVFWGFLLISAFEMPAFMVVTIMHLLAK